MLFEITLLSLDPAPFQVPQRREGIAGAKGRWPVKLKKLGRVGIDNRFVALRALVACPEFRIPGGNGRYAH